MTTMHTQNARNRWRTVAVLLAAALCNTALVSAQVGAPPPMAPVERDHAAHAKAGEEALKKEQHELAVKELGIAMPSVIPLISTDLQFCK